MTSVYKLPEHLEIFGRRYRIEPLPAVNVTDGVIGMAAYTEGTIYIDPQIDQALALSTMWHEAIHIAQIDLHGKPDEESARWISLFAHSLLVHNLEIVNGYVNMLPEHVRPRATKKPPRR